MDQDPKYLKVGIFIITIVVALICFLLWTTNTNRGKELKSFGIYFKEQSLAGLQIDGLVTLKGLKVGTIKKIRFHPTDVERVLVEIAVDSKAPIKEDTSAIVKTNLVTGLASIDLVGSTKESPLLSATTKSGRRPIIPEGKTKLEELQQTLPSILSETNRLLNQAGKFLSDDNAVRIANQLANGEKLTKELANRSTEIGQTITALSEAAKSITTITRTVEQGVQAILDQSKKIALSTDKLISGTNAKLARTADSISEMAKSVKQGKESLLGPTEKNLFKEK